MDSNSIDVGVVYEPDDLIGEELCVVLRVEVWFGRLARIKLQTLANALTQDVESWVRLHDFAHGLLHKLFASVEPVTVATVKVVRQINGQQRARRTRIDRHIVSRVIEEL